MEKRVRANQKKGQSNSEAASAPALSAEDIQWLERPEVQQALKVIRESSKTSPEVVRPSDNLELDLGLDSMQRIELLVALEKELGGDVEESALAEIYTVRQLVDAIRESAAAGKTLTSSGEQATGWKSVLQEEPTDPEVLALARHGAEGKSSFYAGFKPLQIFAADRFHLRVRGLEKLPARVRTSSRPITKASSTRFAGREFAVAGVSQLFVGVQAKYFGSGFMRRLSALAAGDRSIRTRTWFQLCVPAPSDCGTAASSFSIPRASAVSTAP
jgi:acyl carrier protein